ncbi:hypothetical protein ABKN59_010325 [Abortiporus biennis]
MDDEKSPKDDHSVSPPPDMAAAVASMPQPPPPPSSSPTPANAAITANKRYRPAPAKTFQCRGYGECRMVFSRSEHLARHIRKHTGERPFTCHCSKQFSRLDNLRQHAQTVHADKQEQNERMMHELTSLHASMTAAAKGGQPRGKRAQAQAQAAALAAATANSSSGSNGTLDGSLPSMSIKQEDPVMSVPSMRPGTSTGTDVHPTVIPFVTPASPFVPHHLQHQPPPLQPILSTTSNHNNTTIQSPASPFSSPPPHSTSVSPTSQPIPPTTLGPDLAAALAHHQQTQIDPSLQSLPSSPHPSLQPSLSRNTNNNSNHIRRSSSRSSMDRHHRSHPHTYFPYPPPPSLMSTEDLRQPLDQVQLQHHSSQPMLSLQDLDQYQHWSRNIAPSYPPYHSSLDNMDAGNHPTPNTHHHPHRVYTDPLPVATMQEETNRRLQQEAHTNLHFPSTLQQQPPPRPSPTHNNNNPSPILGNDPIQDQTMMMGPSPQEEEEILAAAQLAAAASGGQGRVVNSPVGANTNTGANLGHNLEGSPSWNCAMTQMQMQQQLDHLYRYQQVVAGREVQGQRLHQDSSRQLHNSLSLIGQHHHHPQHQLSPTTPVSSGGHIPPQTPTSSLGTNQRGQGQQNAVVVSSAQALIYSQELSRQQQQQLRRIRHQQQLELELEQEEQEHQQQQQQEQQLREEEDYHNNNSSNNTTDNNSPPHQYFNQVAGYTDESHHRYHLPPQQQHPLVVGVDPLLAMGMGGMGMGMGMEVNQGGQGMIKYESQLE